MLTAFQLPIPELVPVHHCHLREAAEGSTRHARLVTASLGGCRDWR